MQGGGAGRLAKDLKMSLLCDFYGDLLTDKQRDCLELYYDQDLSLGEIAENTGITRQGVRDSIKRGEATLLEMEGALGLCAKERQNYGHLARITEQAKNILPYGDGTPYAAEIRRCVQEILDAVEEMSR